MTDITLEQIAISRAVERLVSVRHEASGSFINTASMYPSGGTVVVWICRKLPHFLVSDFNFAYRECSIMGADREQFLSQAALVAEAAGVHLSPDGAFEILVSEGQLEGAIKTIAGCSQEMAIKFADRTLVIGARIAIDASAPWHSGVSRGEIFGELREVVDFDGEREFYIVPPSGPSRILCIFQESLRAQVQSRLWTPVRVSGFLHYDGKGPFPHLLEADGIDGVIKPEGHFADMRGAFRDFAPSHHVEVPHD